MERGGELVRLGLDGVLGSRRKVADRAAARARRRGAALVLAAQVVGRAQPRAHPQHEGRALVERAAGGAQQRARARLLRRGRGLLHALRALLRLQRGRALALRVGGRRGVLVLEPRIAHAARRQVALEALVPRIRRGLGQG